VDSLEDELGARRMEEIWQCRLKFCSAFWAA
jgi:hypothetical protein